MKYNKIIKVLFCVFFFVMPLLVSAQDDLGEGNGDGDVIDNPAAPINDYIPVALVAAAGLGYVLLRKKTTKA